MNVSFIFGLFFGMFVLEPIVINFIYLSNLDLFNDIILSKKNEERLRKYYGKNIWLFVYIFRFY